MRLSANFILGLCVGFFVASLVTTGIFDPWLSALGLLLAAGNCWIAWKRPSWQRGAR